MDVDAVAIGSFFAGPTFTAPPAAAVKGSSTLRQPPERFASLAGGGHCGTSDERCSVDSSHEQVTTHLSKGPRWGRRAAISLAASKALCSYTCAAQFVQTRLHWRQRRREVPGVSRVHA